MQNCWSVNFARSHDINDKDVGGIGYCTSGCGTYLLQIDIRDYINLKRLQRDEMACQTYSERRRDQSSVRCKSVETLEFGSQRFCKQHSQCLFWIMHRWIYSFWNVWKTILALIEFILGVTYIRLIVSIEHKGL